jgi:DNA sulfur modification protein DndB
MTTTTSHTDNASNHEFIECKDQLEAQRMAFDDMSAGGSQAYSCLYYKQGKRSQVTVSTTMFGLIQLQQLDSADKKNDRRDVETKMNRPLDKSHVHSIYQYLVKACNEDHPYILPPFVLNAKTTRLRIYYYGKGPIKSGYVVVDKSARLFVTDGQHRTAAILQIYQELEDSTWQEISDDGVAINIVLENADDRIHQDFVDCSKTKPIQPSLLKAWDKENAHNKLTKDVADQSPLFAKRIDKLSGTLGKDRDFVFTLNQLSLATAELLFGSADKPKINSGTKALLRTDEQYTKALDFVLKFLMEFANCNDEWSLLLDSDDVDFYDLRRRRIDFNSTGFQVVCRVGHLILTDAKLGGKERDALIGKMAQLDFDRKADIWQGNIVSSADYSIINKRTTIDRAVDTACEKIGYDRSKREPKSII